MMETRMDRMVRRVMASMTQVEMEDWDDALEGMGWTLDTFADDLKDGDMAGINSVGRAVKRVEREEGSVGDPITRRSVDNLLSEVSRVLNTAEGENRRMEDVMSDHKSRCQAIIRELRGFKGKFEALKGG